MDWKGIDLQKCFISDIVEEFKVLNLVLVIFVLLQFHLKNGVFIDQTWILETGILKSGDTNISFFYNVYAFLIELVDPLHNLR